MKSKLVWLILLTVALVLSTTSLVSAWNTGQGNFQRHGSSSQVLDKDALTLKWAYYAPVNGGPFQAEPSELNGRAFMVFSNYAAGANTLEAMDLNTGAPLWIKALVGTGTTGRATPTVVTIDTGGGNFGDLVYVSNFAAGGGAALLCVRAADASTKWSGLLGTRDRRSRPALADTNGDGTLDIVIVTTEAGVMKAFNPVTGAAAWTSAVLAANTQQCQGPTLSTDNKIVYTGTSDATQLLGKGFACSTSTGGLAGSFDPAGDGGACAFEANPIYIDDNNVIFTGYGAGAPATGRIWVRDRLLGPKGKSSAAFGPIFGSPALYVDPAGYIDAAGDTNLVVAAEGNVVAEQDIFSRWIPGVRVSGASLLWFYPPCGNIMYNNVVAGGNGVGVTSDRGAVFGSRMYVFEAGTAGGFTHWAKNYAASDAFPGPGVWNVTGQSIVDAGEPGNDSDIVLLTAESYGIVYGWVNQVAPRSRLLPATGPCGEVFLNVSLAFNGVDVETLLVDNTGNATGTYTVATDTVVAAASVGGNTHASLRVYNAKPARREFAGLKADELTVTGKGRFFKKNPNNAQVNAVLDEYPTLVTRTAYSSKLGASAKTAAVPPAWLTAVSLDGGSIAGPGTGMIQVTANSATLGLGEYFAELDITVTGGETDADLYGTNLITVPVHFVVGFIPGSTYIDASDASLEIDNQGGFGHSQTSGFPWDGQAPGNLFSGGIVIMDQVGQAGGGVVNEAVYATDVTTLADDNLPQYVDTNPSSYVATANVCTTGYKMAMAACSLRVNQTSIGLWDGAFCDSVITNQYVIKNMGPAACTLQVGFYTDWDIDGGTDNLGGGDAAHNQVNLYSDATPTLLYGTMRVPTDNGGIAGVIVDHPTSIYNAPGPGTPDYDSLEKWFDSPNGAVDAAYGNTAGPDDKGYSVNSSNIIIANGGTHFVSYVVFGWDENDVPLNQVVRKVWLRQLGYYRGDVNTDNRGMERTTNGSLNGLATNGGVINLADVVYLVRRVLKPAANQAAWPFDDQGDVNNSGGIPNLADVIFLFNSTRPGRPQPTDYNRFGNPQFNRSSLFTAPNWN